MSKDTWKVDDEDGSWELDLNDVDGSIEKALEEEFGSAEERPGC